MLDGVKAPAWQSGRSHSQGASFEIWESESTNNQTAFVISVLDIWYNICIHVYKYFLYVHILYYMLILAFRIMSSEFSSPIIQLFVVRLSYISFCVMQQEVMIKRRWGQLTDSDTFDFFFFFWGGGGVFSGGRWWMWMWRFGIESKSCWSLTIDVFSFYICLVISTMISQRNQRYERWRREANAKFFEVPVYRPFFSCHATLIRVSKVDGNTDPQEC